MRRHREHLWEVGEGGGGADWESSLETCKNLHVNIYIYIK